MDAIEDAINADAHEAINERDEVYALGALQDAINVLEDAVGVFSALEAVDPIEKVVDALEALRTASGLKEADAFK